MARSVRIHILAVEDRPGKPLLIYVRKTLGLVETIVQEVMKRRPGWGRSDLRVLEYGGRRRWKFQWVDRTLQEETS